jgi:hypothetical protein
MTVEQLMKKLAKKNPKAEVLFSPDGHEIGGDSYAVATVYSGGGNKRPYVLLVR